jgi:predicted 3-demethylubiquinone-9 3-methyltransferase (glyoxalase superfamily)
MENRAWTNHHIGDFGCPEGRTWPNARIVRAHYHEVVVNIAPFLWFDDDAEQALDFYAGVFSNSEVVNVTRMDVPSMPNGGFVIGTIRIENLSITIMNGGPTFALTEAFSLVVSCQNQTEVDYYWSALGEGGQPGQCGWLKDQFGLSWQVIPTLLGELMSDPDPQKSGRVRDAMMTMTKIECDQLQAAYDA